MIYTRITRMTHKTLALKLFIIVFHRQRYLVLEIRMKKVNRFIDLGF